MKTNDADRPIVVAHRGASRHAPENTLPAFRLAWEKGADAIEGDFQLTQDGHIVCMHDPNTKRVSGKNIVVKESTLGELRKLDVGSYRGKGYVGTAIPTIAEVFSTIPKGKTIYIEVKSGTEIIPRLLTEIDRSGLDKAQIVMISFNEDVIREVKTNMPPYKAYWLSELKKRLSGRISPSAETILKTLDRTKADGFSSNPDFISESFVRRITAHGYEYHVWTIDDPITARRFFQWGAKSVTTNDPEYVLKGFAA